jgi:hypothetical protein
MRTVNKFAALGFLLPIAIAAQRFSTRAQIGALGQDSLVESAELR